MVGFQAIHSLPVLHIPITGKSGTQRRIVVAWAKVADDDFGRTRVLRTPWCLSSSGYPCQSIPTGRPYRRQTILLHHLVFARYHGCVPSGLQIDHADRDRLNAHPANLRAVTQSVNNLNTSRPNTNRSGFRGVCWGGREHKWRAYVTIERKQQYLGTYRDPAEAARAVNDAYRRLLPYIQIPNPQVEPPT